MAKCVLWQMPDGSVAVTIPNPRYRLRGEPEEMFLDGVALQAMHAVSLRGADRLPNVEASDLPASRRFRDCWRYNGQTVAADLDLARQQLLTELRAERNARLVVSDGHKARLEDVGTAEQLQDLKTYRQALRDLPAVVAQDLANLGTAEALSNYVPPWPTSPV